MSKKQDWSVGEIVKVGFLKLRVVQVVNVQGGKQEYVLSSPDLSKMYGFSPYEGLHRIYEGE